MISLSLQPSPASETSAFNKISAFVSRLAGIFPLVLSASSRSRSSALSRTTYLFTATSRAAILASVPKGAEGSESIKGCELVDAADYGPLQPCEAHARPNWPCLKATLLRAHQRQDCANRGHCRRVRRTGQVDPKRKFSVSWRGRRGPSNVGRGERVKSTRSGKFTSSSKRSETPFP